MNERPKRIDATGTIRRTRALSAIGFTQQQLASHLELSPAHVHTLLNGAVSQVFPATAQRIARQYRRLCWRPPTGPAADAERDAARERGWPNPLAWDDIDDPRERPHGSPSLAVVPVTPVAPLPRKTPPLPIDEAAVLRAMDGEEVKLNLAERREAITRLHARRWGDPKIAEALHLNVRTVFRNRRLLGLDGWASPDEARKSA